jgi:hypothetical protein
MEHVLDEYERAYDPEEPRICMDETTKQAALRAAWANLRFAV